MRIIVLSLCVVNRCRIVSVVNLKYVSDMGLVSDVCVVLMVLKCGSSLLLVMFCLFMCVCLLNLSRCGDVW